MNQAELAEMGRLQAALAAAQAGQPVAQAQPAPQVQQNFIAQAAPVTAVHTVQMPFPIDSQGVRFIPSLPTWVIWSLSLLTLLVVVALLVMTSVWSSKPATVSATAVPTPQAITYTIPPIKIDPIKIDVNVTGVQPGKP